MFVPCPAVVKRKLLHADILGHMVGSKCSLKMHVRNLGYPFPLQIGGRKTPFGRLRKSTAISTAYIFRTKHDINNRASACVDNYKGFATSSQNLMNFGPQTPQNRTGIFTHPHYFVPSQSIVQPPGDINVEPHSHSKRNGIGFVCSSDSKPQKMLSWKCYRVGRP